MKENKGLLLLLSIPIIISLFFLSTFLCIRFSLNGEKEIRVSYGTEFHDPGTKATVFGRKLKVKVYGKVNAKKIGTYELVYETENKIGMKKKIKRKVIVESKQSPTIQLVGDEVQILPMNQEYEEPGYQATDVEKQDITDSVVVSGYINPKEFGIYVIKYEVKDKSGNVGKAERKIIVKDSEKPVLELKGYQAMTLYTDEEYVEPGYSAMDNIDKDITKKVITKNNIKQEPGMYKVTYEVTDSSGNKVKKERQIYVIEHLEYKEKYEKLENVSKGWWSDNKYNQKRPLGGNNGKSLEEYQAYHLGEDKKMIYLTFDEGSNDTYLDKIVDVLDKNDVKGTFFLCQNYMASHPELIRKMAKNGHTVGNHTHHHYNMPSLATQDKIDEYVKEVRDVEHIYKQITGKNMIKVYREPKGEWSTRSLKILSDLGYSTYFWSADYLDWDKPVSKEDALNHMLKRYHNGAIYLLHPKNIGNYEAMEDFIKTMKKKGYQFGLVKDIPKNKKQG